MGYQEDFYPESKFGGFTDIDGTIAFYIRVNSFIDTSQVILDVGCGRGALQDDSINVRKDLQNLQGKCAKVIGIDIDEKAKKNPFLDEFRLIGGEEEKWPVEDESIDVCVSDAVLEHIKNPELFFSECNRVLKPGGFLAIRAPNVLSYVGLVSKLIPDKFHSSVTNVVQEGRSEEDVFPTYYRCNTRRQLKKNMEKYDFDHCVYGYEAEPSYLSFSKLFYFLGVLHQKFAPNIFKPALFAFGRKN